jgi:hypothetical protein
MLNEELGTYALLERTNMQHVERSNEDKAAGSVGVKFQSDGTVQNDTTHRTEVTKLQLDRWERLLLNWELGVDDKWDELLLFGQQGASQQRIAERGLAELRLELLEIDRVSEAITMERDALKQRDAAKRFAAELAHAKRVPDCEQQKAAERAEGVDTGAIPIPAQRCLLWSGAAEREADDLLTAERKDSEGTVTERPAAKRVRAGQTNETVKSTATDAPKKYAASEPMATERVTDDQEVGHKATERLYVNQVSLEGAEEVFGQRDLDKMPVVRCSVDDDVDHWTGEFSLWKRIGRKEYGWKSVRWRIKIGRVNWKSVRWRSTKRRVSLKPVRWCVVHQHEPIEAECGVEGVKLIEDDQNCRMADCHGR